MRKNDRELLAEIAQLYAHFGDNTFKSLASELKKEDTLAVFRDLLSACAENHKRSETEYSDEWPNRESRSRRSTSPKWRLQDMILNYAFSDSAKKRVLGAFGYDVLQGKVLRTRKEIIEFYSIACDGDISGNEDKWQLIIKTIRDLGDVPVADLKHRVSQAYDISSQDSTLGRWADIIVRD